MITFTLSELADRLIAAEGSAISVLKAAFLNDPLPDSPDTGALNLANTRELAQFTAVCAILASQSNGKDELHAIRATHADADPQVLDTAFAQHEATLAWQRFTRKNGELILQEGIPVLELDPTKLASVLRDPLAAFTALRKLDLTALVGNRAFHEAFSSQVSHPTKLSAGRGTGGFFKTRRVDIPMDCQSVTEEDFRTRETATLSCSAGYQKMWWLLLPVMRVDGQPHRLASYFGSHEQATREVTTLLEAEGVAQAPALLQALATPALPSFSGEPQVFCGDVPRAERLSVLAPFGLFNEMLRARKTLERAYETERDGRIAQADAEIAALDAEIAALRDAPAPTKEAKKQAQLRKAELAASLKEAKGKRKALAAKYLNIPKFTLPIGGAVPRNVAMDLDVSLHTANVRVRIPTTLKRTHALSSKAFIATSLLAAPRVVLRSLPAYLQADALGVDHYRARRALFVELIAEAMLPLLALREEWAERAKDMSGQVALSGPAQEFISDITASETPWALFVKGADTLNQKESMGRLAPLVREIAGKVSGSLQQALPDFPALHAAEILELAAEAVQMEKA